MKIQHIWSVLCRESIINQDDNVTSLIGVLEVLTVGITLKKDEVKKEKLNLNVPINYELVTLWRKTNPNTEFTTDMRLTIESPSGNEMASITNSLVFKKDVERFRNRNKINGFKVEEQGTYWFIISTKSEESKNFKEMHRIPLEVKVVYASNKPDSIKN